MPKPTSWISYILPTFVKDPNNIFALTPNHHQQLNHTHTPFLLYERTKYRYLKQINPEEKYSKLSTW